MIFISVSHSIIKRPLHKTPKIEFKVVLHIFSAACSYFNFSVLFYQDLWENFVWCRPRESKIHCTQRYRKVLKYVAIILNRVIPIIPKSRKFCFYFLVWNFLDDLLVISVFGLTNQKYFETKHVVQNAYFRKIFQEFEWYIFSEP